MAQLAIILLTAAIVLDTAHNISPVLMAWSHTGYRQMMLKRKARFIAVPCAMIGITMAIGWATSAGWTGYDLGHPHQLWRVTGLDNPFPAVLWIYWVWNIYHFGMQNFGLARLVRRWLKRPGPRWIDQLAWLAATTAGILFLPYWIGLIVISFTHWLTELSLTTWVIRRAWFSVAVLLFGLAAFLWTLPPWRLPDPASGNFIYAIPALLGVRTALGFNHFWYDLWVWKFSDPQVRATIGKELFA